MTVFDARENAGGLLRFGIPNFKLNKAIIDRKINVLKQEGIQFEFGVMLVPVNPTEPVSIQNDPTLGNTKKTTIEQLSKEYDAVVVCTERRKHAT